MGYRIDGEGKTEVHAKVKLVHAQVEFIQVDGEVAVRRSAAAIVSIVACSLFCNLAIFGIVDIKLCPVNTEFNHFEDGFLVQVVSAPAADGNAEVALILQSVNVFVLQFLDDVAEVEIFRPVFPDFLLHIRFCIFIDL